MTTRFKARLLSAIGVTLGGSSTVFSLVDHHRWYFVASNLVFFTMTVALAGATWELTRRGSSR